MAPKMTAADFVRSRPDSMPPTQVVEEAAAMGLKMSLASVHTTRRSDRLKALKGKALHAKPAAKKARAKMAEGPREQNVEQFYTFLTNFIREHGRRPDMREIHKATGLGKSFVYKSLRQLREEGRIVVPNRDYRSMCLPAAASPTPPPSSNGAVPQGVAGLLEAKTTSGLSYLDALRADLTRRLGHLALSGDTKLGTKVAAVKEVLEMLEERGAHEDAP